jgi:hypothetical protein
VVSECQAQPEAWSDWGGFVDTQKQTDSKNPLRIKTAYKKEKEAEKALKINLE